MKRSSYMRAYLGSCSSCLSCTSACWCTSCSCTSTTSFIRTETNWLLAFYFSTLKFNYKQDTNNSVLIIYIKLQKSINRFLSQLQLCKCIVLSLYLHTIYIDNSFIIIQLRGVPGLLLIKVIYGCDCTSVET